MDHGSVYRRCECRDESSGRLLGAVPRRHPLASLTAGDVQAMFTAITRDDTALGHPVSASTLHRISLI